MSRLPHVANAFTSLFTHTERVLVALSGGGDSVALLHMLHEAGLTLSAATVDHGWRKEAKAEQALAAAHCTRLGVPHHVLTLHPAPASQAKARIARYNALTAHACATGCTATALGHTADDQRETLAMRALRLKPQSGARGLSGMSDVTHHALTPYQRTRLIRPLLRHKRQDLRNWMIDRGLTWAEDATNEDISFERIRERQRGSTQHTDFAVDLSQAAQRHRAWINTQTAEHLLQNSKWEGDSFTLKRTANTPATIEREALATLVLAMGGMPFRPTRDKISACLEAAPGCHTLGRCLITTSDLEIIIKREDRNPPPPPQPGTLYDERFYVEANGDHTPFIAALERFRPSCDDALHAALMRLINQ